MTGTAADSRDGAGTVGTPPAAPFTSPPHARVERLDTIVVGGGQAGLAVGHELAARDVDFLILDAGARVGDAWRGRWDSLRLFTPAERDGLPGMPFPAPPGHLPDKDEVADYLARYAERFDLPIRPGTRVDALAHDGERWVVRAGARRFEADNVVVATGAFHTPRVPEPAGRLSSGILQLHSRAYASPFALPDGPALVVGAGNSGAQIALELSRHREVWLAGRDTGHLPRRLLGRDLFDWAWPLMQRLTLDTRMGRRLRHRMRSGGDRLVGIPERTIVAAGIRRVGRVTDARGGLPVCDGRTLEPRVVIWCTGFAPDFGWIHAPVLDEHGTPRHRRGVSTDLPGLYFVGLRFQYRLSSSLLGGVAADASYVAADVARRSMAGATA